MRSQLGVLLLLCAFALPVAAQQNPGAPLPPAQRRGGNNVNQPVTDEDEAQARMATELAKKQARERVAAIKADTDKLLKLSVELKQYVDKSNENVLSLDVVKKAEEIEKLARTVKDKMKGSS